MNSKSMLMLTVMALAMSACAPRAPRDFEICVKALTEGVLVSGARIVAADWCMTHNNGDL
jgi:hypothetical protein